MSGGAGHDIFVLKVGQASGDVILDFWETVLILVTRSACRQFQYVLPSRTRRPLDRLYDAGSERFPILLA